MAASDERVNARVTLHVERVQGPRHLLTLIDALDATEPHPFASGKELVRFIQQRYDFGDQRGESVTMAMLLGILERTDDGLRLSARGHAVGRARPGTREDLLHFLLHSGIEPDAEGAGRSWAYRSFCAQLWNAERVPLVPAELSRLTADVLGAAEAAFPDASDFAFSRKSTSGMRTWLEALDPPVIVDRPRATFERRTVCSRELLLLAIGAVARRDGAQLDTELLLTTDRRHAICEICLLDPAAFDRRLDNTLPSFPGIITPGTRTGPYGRFVRLHAYPTVEQVVDAGGSAR